MTHYALRAGYGCRVGRVRPKNHVLGVRYEAFVRDEGALSKIVRYDRSADGWWIRGEVILASPYDPRDRRG